MLGQARLSKGQLFPTGLEKRLGYGPAVLDHPTGARNREEEKNFQPISNNPRSSILPERVPDPRSVIKHQHL